MDIWTIGPESADALRVVEKEHGEFKVALGDLTLHWSDAERVLRRTLVIYAGVTHEVGRALFSGTRARAAMAQISSIMHNTDVTPDRASDLKQIFEVMSAINTMRDFIVHHVDGSMIESHDADPTQRKLSDEHWSSRIGKGKTYWISSALVWDMCADLTECCWRLQAHFEPPSKPFQPGVGPTGARQPWRYKPPQPAK